MSTDSLPNVGPHIGSDPLLERLERLNKRRAMPPRFAPPSLPESTATLTGPPMIASLAAPPTGPSRQPNQPNQPNQPKRRRRGPAKVAKAGALLISCVSTGGLAALFAYFNEATAANESLSALPAPIAVTAAPAGAPATDVTDVTDVTTSVTPETAAETTAATPAAADTVSAFNGDVVDTKFGPVQVQAQITGGVLTEVAVIQYPDDDRKSVRINARALPTLRSEALAAQDADVDTVSGATYTSVAYAKSLQSAIDQARAASAIA